MRKQKMLPMRELISLSRQLALVIDSDLALYEGLNLIGQQTKLKASKQFIARTQERISRGASLSESCASESDVLPDFFINMVSVGEQSGNLIKVLNRTADTFEKDAKVSARVLSAVTYPIILSVLMICVIVLLLVEVLPMFNEVLGSLGGTMPGITRVLMNIGSFIGTYFYIFLAVIAVIILAVILLRQTKSGKAKLDALKLASPIRKNIIKNIDCVRFARNLAMLIRSGIGIANGVKMAATTMSNEKLKSMARDAAKRIEDGETLKNALASLGLFSGLLLRILSVAESTGHTDDMLDKAADNIEEELNERLTKLTTVLEPALIIVLSIIVGVVLISVILPVTTIMNTIG
jgi:type IV pilus assembly protein PilC